MTHRLWVIDDESLLTTWLHRTKFCFNSIIGRASFWLVNNPVDALFETNWDSTITCFCARRPFWPIGWKMRWIKLNLSSHWSLRMTHNLQTENVSKNTTYGTNHIFRLAHIPNSFHHDNQKWLAEKYLLLIGFWLYANRNPNSHHSQWQETSLHSDTIWIQFRLRNSFLSGILVQYRHIR